MVLPHPGGDERRQREPKQQMQIRPQHATGNMLRCLQEVMMVVPVDPDVDETQDIAEENRKEWLQGRKTVPCGAFISSTMMVMMTANTPSLKASMRPLVILPSPSVDLRVKRQQPVTGRFHQRPSPWLRRRVFEKDPRVYFRRRFQERLPIVVISRNCKKEERQMPAVPDHA